MATTKSKRAAQGAGTIRQRPDGRWEARYTVGRDPGTGKQIQRSIYGATQAEVLKKLQQVSVALESGTYIEPSKMTVSQWLDIWLNEYTANIKPATLTAYRGRVEYRIKPALGALKLSALKPHAIQSFYNSMQNDAKEKKALSPKSIFNIHGILHKALSQAVELGYLRVNPADVCKLPRVTRPDIKPLDGAQIATFLEAIKGHKYEALFAVGLFTGLRQGELLGLTWDSVNFESGTLYVYRQLQFLDGGYSFRPLKNDKARLVAPARFVIDILREQYRRQTEWRMNAKDAWRDGNYVFTDELGEHLSRSTTYHQFKTIVKDIGLPKSRLHDLRHSYAVASLQAGDDIKTVQENLGHHTASFTLDTYAHVTERMKQESAARMDAFIQKVKQGG